jgi:lytic murein transglycosylase
MRLSLVAAAFTLAFSVQSATAQSCGGDFGAFVNALRTEASQRGVSSDTIAGFFRSVRHDQSVINADNRQGIFQRPFLDFSRALISQDRMDRGRQNADRYASTFQRMQRETGVSREIILAFWAFETDFGAFQGDFNTVNALVTLAHDCRRPEIFRPQVFSAIELYRRGNFDPASTTGAWAGEIGMVQMLPQDILESGTDGDGDGHVDLRGSAPDALLSGANLLQNKGWRANEPWMIEIAIPQGIDLSQTGLRTEHSVSDWARMGVQPRYGALPSGGMPASVILPQGYRGPAFMVFNNYRVLFEWNQSFTYVTTAAYFATRLGGAPVYTAGNPDQGLSGEQMVTLQRLLQGRGFDVGLVDGILGANTRAAVQDVQSQLGMPADGWPTPGLLQRL